MADERGNDTPPGDVSMASPGGTLEIQPSRVRPRDVPQELTMAIGLGIGIALIVLGILSVAGLIRLDSPFGS